MVEILPAVVAGAIPVAHGGKRCNADLERIQQVPPLDPPVKQGPGGEHRDDEEEEGLKLRVFEELPQGAEETDEDPNKRDRNRVCSPSAATQVDGYRRPEPSPLSASGASRPVAVSSRACLPEM
jgi:hypothetical protein